MPFRCHWAWLLFVSLLVVSGCRSAQAPPPPPPPPPAPSPPAPIETNETLEAELLVYRLGPPTFARWTQAARALAEAEGAGAPAWNDPGAAPLDRLAQLRDAPEARALLAEAGFSPRAFVFATVTVQRVRQADAAGAEPLTHPDNAALVRARAAEADAALGGG